VWGSSVVVKVIAFNVYGQSLQSSSGSGAIILTYPDAPLSLQEYIPGRQATVIGLQWSSGVANGGASVLDYKVSYDQANGTYVEL